MWKFVVFLCALLATSNVAAQSPAVGPQEPAANLSECSPSQSNAPCKAEFGIFIVTNTIRGTTQKALDAANAQLQKDGRSSRVSIQSLQTYQPRRMQTQHLNQPNEWFIRVPYILTIKVTIPVTSDRRISIPLDINFTCDNWQTNNGQIVIRSSTGPASFEGGNILESVFNIGNFIDAQVRGAFVAPPPVTQQLPNSKCSTIGGSTSGTAQPDDDVVIWTVPRPLKPIGDVAATSAVEITFNRLKRLQARSAGGGILYRDVEDILLNVSANTSRQQKALKMREGDDVALSLPTIRLSPANFDSLVIVGNVEQPPNNPKDSAFATATKAQNYRPGTHVIRIPKWYSQPPGKGSTKPILLSVAAYELSYTVRHVSTGVIGPGAAGGAGAGAAGTGAAGTVTGGGTVQPVRPAIQKAAPATKLNQRQ